jgi:hypothetical protein
MLENALRGPTYLLRARLEDSGGDAARARGFYRRFLQLYDRPMPAQAPLVEEAKAALARMETDR